jgi:predicted 2-oxoglutarate/Fe(II)-dependent dioxygenase YbiX
MIPVEPKWKSLIVETVTPVFTPQQCQDIINMGESLKKEQAQVGSAEPQGHTDTEKRITTISWIPFDKLPPMYKTLDDLIYRTNVNHFGFDGVRITEPAQYTHYPVGGFYGWHTDNDVVGKDQPPVRKISMTLLLSPLNEFEGGDLELMDIGKVAKLKQGHAVFFASFIPHRVTPVTRGERRSLVMWFGGPSFR